MRHRHARRNVETVACPARFVRVAASRSVTATTAYACRKVLAKLLRQHSPLVITPRGYARTRLPSAPVEPPTLVRFVVLSMMLHVLVVVFFGNTTGGGGRRGDASLGTLDVTLRRLSPESGSGFRLAPGAETRSPGTALLRRLGAAPPAPPRVGEPAPAATSRSTAPPAPTPPAMPRSDAPAATTPSASAETTPVERAPAQPEAVPPAREAAPPPATVPFESLPQVDRKAPEEVDKPFAPAAASPPKIEREPAPPIDAPRREPPAREPPEGAGRPRRARRSTDDRARARASGRTHRAADK